MPTAVPSRPGLITIDTIAEKVFAGKRIDAADARFLFDHPDLIDLATGLDIITKRGSFYSYGDIRLGQGRENAKDFLRTNADLSDEIELAVRQRALSGEVPLDFGSGSDDEDGAGGVTEDEI
jgi:hypothetical protein